MMQYRRLPGQQPHHHPSHAYTSQQENMDIGLYYYNGRYYAPTLARFISADTLVPDPANPQAFNRYSYVENRPLNFNDPTGHFTEDAIRGYLWEYCSGNENCFVEIFNQWRGNEDWWSMLRTAEAGDILIGYHRGVEFFHTFSGEGATLLTGIFASDANGNAVDRDFYNSFTLMNYFTRKMPEGDWHWIVNGRRFATPGFIRWRDNLPSFFVRQGYEMEQRQMPPLVHKARYWIWWITNAFTGAKYIEGVTQGFLYSLGASAIDIPGWFAENSGTTPNDVTVSFTEIVCCQGKERRPAGTQIFRQFQGIWIAIEPFFED